MKVQDLDQQELIDLAELLNQITLDLLDEPIEVMDFAMMKSRALLVRTFLNLASGNEVVGFDELMPAQEFYDEVFSNEEL